MKVWIDQDLCTGDGLCEEIAPDVFTLLDDGLAYVKEGEKVFSDPGGAAGGGLSDVLVEGATIAAVNPAGTGTKAAAHFTFNIPQGNDGGTGPAGNDGAQGPPGEITQSQLDSAISGTSANTNGVSTLGLSISDPPTQGELQSVANKLDELINALRR